MNRYHPEPDHPFSHLVATPATAGNCCLSPGRIGRIAAIRETTVMHHACDIRRLRTGTVGRRR